MRFEWTIRKYMISLLSSSTNSLVVLAATIKFLANMFLNAEHMHT